MRDIDTNLYDIIERMAKVSTKTFHYLINYMKREDISDTDIKILDDIVDRYFLIISERINNNEQKPSKHTQR